MRKEIALAEKYLIITGSRAEWGLLEPLTWKLLTSNPVTVLVTGSHLLNDSVKVEFPFTETLEILTDSDTSNGVCSSMGLAMIKFGEAFKRIKPDKIIVLGDRYEILAASIVAHNMEIPLCHIQGGDVTSGSLDDGYRNCITQLATIHFVATEEASKRINKPNTHVVGSLGCVMPVITHSCGKIDNITAVFHSHLGDYKSEFMALKEFLKDKNVTWFAAGMDAGGKWINNQIKITSLSRENYLAILRSSIYIIGNSSSGIIEAPTLRIPTINIGMRQSGRERAKSVIDCEGTVEAITAATKKIRYLKDEDFKNPYEMPNTHWLIVEILNGQPRPNI